MADEVFSGAVTVVDIGAYSVKFLELMRREDMTKFLAFNERVYELSEDERESEIKSVIEQELSSGKYKAEHIIVYANLPSLNIHVIQFPNIPESEIKQSVKFKAKKLVPYAMTEAYSGSCINEKVGLDERVNVLFAAAQKKEIEDVAGYFSAYSEKLRGISVRGFGIQKILEQMPLEDEFYVHIDIGYEHTNVDIFKKDRLQFSRIIPMGLAGMAEVIAKSETGKMKDFEEDIPESFDKLMKTGYISDDRRKDLEDADKKTAESIEEGLLRLLQRVRLTLGYFKTQYKITKFEKIYISGGGAAINHINEFFKIQFAVDSKKFDFNLLIEDLPEELKKNMSSFVAMFGIMYENPLAVSLNLIPVKEEEKKFDWSRMKTELDAKELWAFFCAWLETIRNPKLIYGVIGSIIGTICIAHFMYSEYLLSSYKSQRKSVDVQMSALQDIESLVAQYDEIRDRINSENKIIEQNFRDNIKLDKVLNELLKNVWGVATVKKIDYKIGKSYEMVENERIIKTQYLINLTGKCNDVSEIKQIKGKIAQSQFFSDVSERDTSFFKENTEEGIRTFVNFVLAITVNTECDDCFYSLEELLAMQSVTAGEAGASGQ